MIDFINYILKKKELKGIDINIANRIIKRTLTTKELNILEKNNEKNKEFKKIIRKARAQLRRQFGVFQNPKIDRALLAKNKDWINLLKSHNSSKERLPFYKELYEEIFNITSLPKTILDIGCGMNPISFEFMDIKNITYYALDININDLKIIKYYFSTVNENCKIIIFDATHDAYVFNKKFDVCFCFKLFEILKINKGHKLTEEIINKIPSKWIIASFSTKTISGMNMKKTNRVWFEVMLKRLNLEFKILKKENEIFYCIKKY